ncbi:MAG TPA: hypothetical protein VFN68_01450 [Acidimicrobiales bacterium]|nr:hypothetical protein [Acidimicrobiales bacterium]
MAALTAGAVAAQPARPAAAATVATDVPGYWMAAADGGVDSYDARWQGSMRGTPLKRPIVGAAATPDGQGYWMAASDGGIFAYGDATFYGSTGNIRLNRPIVGMAPTPDGHGYWLVASDGGIFTYGDAPFLGSAGSIRLARPIVAMAATGDGRGYWMMASDGGIFTYGDAPFLGSAGGSSNPAPFSAFMTTTHGTPGASHGDGLPLPGSVGYDVSQWQCGGLPAARSFAVVQASAGAIDAGPNPCYRQEAAWAGQNMSAYVFGDGLPSPAPSTSSTGPAGVCRGDAGCEGYNFGYYWARHWVDYSSGVGVFPAFWWFDVESGYWSSNLSVNAAVIRGAIAGFHSEGVGAGIYSTAYQWPRIAGSLSLPGIPLWVAGADYVSGDAYAATSFCADGRYGFAGGRVTLVQYGYTGSTPARFDPDFACA